MTAKTRNVSALIFALALSLMQSAQGSEARTHVGDVERVQKLAQAIFQESLRNLAQESPVLFQDLLKTGSGARLKAKLADGTELTLGERAELVVDEFVYEPDGTEGVLAMKVLKGAFLFVGGKVEEKADSRVRIATPYGVLGIRGTTVWGGPIDGGYGVLVLDGEVTFETRRGTVTVQAGRGTMLYDDGLPPFTPFPWSKEKTDRAVATISFTE